MSNVFCAKYVINESADNGDGTAKIKGTIEDSSPFGYNATNAAVGDVVVNYYADSGTIDRWVVTQIISATGGSLECNVKWDDAGTAYSAPYPGVSSISRVSLNWKLAETPASSYTGIDLPILNQITNIDKRTKMEIKYVTSTQPWVPGVIAAKSSVTHDFTVVGTGMAEKVDVSCSSDLKGLLVSAYVKALNTITLVLFNPTDVPIEILSSNFVTWKGL